MGAIKAVASVIPGTNTRQQRLFKKGLRKQAAKADALCLMEWPDGSVTMHRAHWDSDISGWRLDNGRTILPRGKGGDPKSFAGCQIIQAYSEEFSPVSTEAALMAGALESDHTQPVDTDGNPIGRERPPADGSQPAARGHTDPTESREWHYDDAAETNGTGGGSDAERDGDTAETDGGDESAGLDELLSDDPTDPDSSLDGIFDGSDADGRADRDTGGGRDRDREPETDGGRAVADIKPDFPASGLTYDAVEFSLREAAWYDPNPTDADDARLAAEHAELAGQDEGQMLKYIAYGAGGVVAIVGFFVILVWLLGEIGGDDGGGTIPLMLSALAGVIL